MLRPSLVMTEMTSAEAEAGGEHQTEEDREAKKSMAGRFGGTHGRRAARVPDRRTPFVPCRERD
jgi:hypothetical protein